MNYKSAAGRNWTREQRRRRLVHLERESSTAEMREPSPEWYSLGNYHGAAGRNWAEAARRVAPVRLQAGNASTGRPDEYPLRERGGGDHDEPYRYLAPNADWTFPFSTRQYARLLILRTKLSERHAGRVEPAAASASVTA
jgi:hypothetical protein